MIERRRGDRRAWLATVGHELRTPLTSIRGYIETVLDGDELDPQTTRRFLETARREALRLGRLVEGMLEFSLLDLSAGSPQARCDLDEQVRATIDAVLPLAQRRGVSIGARVLRSGFVRIDGDACVHALLNVVENAVKYGREGGNVTIECSRQAPFLYAIVDDDGPGVSPAERDAIFGLGFRGGEARRPGCGIGLAVVKAIVTRAGGDILVDSSPLGGARFVLRFPEA